MVRVELSNKFTVFVKEVKAGFKLSVSKPAMDIIGLFILKKSTNFH